MSEEEKAIEYWKHSISLYHYNTQLASEHYANVLLNLIENQQQELQLKDKVINKMSEWIAHQDLDEEICTKKIDDCYADIYDSDCYKKCVEEYFINKVKGE